LLGTRRDIPALMREADLMVNSSIFEGLPIALIEAAISALPIVATDVGGNGELVDPFINGLIVPPGDPESLAQAILQVFENEARYVAMSHASAIKSRDFSMDKCAREHLRLYADICPSALRIGTTRMDKPLPLSAGSLSRKYSGEL
jgi:glycosyltransferase involved in cell wall biosynthesis